MQEKASQFSKEGDNRKKLHEICFYYEKTVKISTLLLLVTIGFCLVLSSAAEPYFQGFCGIDVFIWERLNSSIYAEMV